MSRCDVKRVIHLFDEQVKSYTQYFPSRSKKTLYNEKHPVNSIGLQINHIQFDLTKVQWSSYPACIVYISHNSLPRTQLHLSNSQHYLVVDLFLATTDKYYRFYRLLHFILFFAASSTGSYGSQ